MNEWMKENFSWKGISDTRLEKMAKNLAYDVMVGHDSTLTLLKFQFQFFYYYFLS